MFGFWVEMLDTSYVSCYDPQEEVLVISFFNIFICVNYQGMNFMHTVFN